MRCPIIVTKPLTIMSVSSTDHPGTGLRAVICPVAASSEKQPEFSTKHYFVMIFFRTDVSALPRPDPVESQGGMVSFDPDISK